MSVFVSAIDSYTSPSLVRKAAAKRLQNLPSPTPKLFWRKKTEDFKPSGTTPSAQNTAWSKNPLSTTHTAQALGSKNHDIDKSVNK